jgi:hypothetical protein
MYRGPIHAHTYTTIVIPSHRSLHATSVRILSPFRPGGNTSTGEPDFNHRAFCGELDDQLRAISCTLGSVHAASDERLDSLYAVSEPATSPTTARNLLNESLAAQLSLQTAVMTKMLEMDASPRTSLHVKTV